MAELPSRPPDPGWLHDADDHAHGFTPDERAAWHRYRFTRQDAAAWADHGFTPVEAGLHRDFLGNALQPAAAAQWRREHHGGPGYASRTRALVAFKNALGQAVADADWETGSQPDITSELTSITRELLARATARLATIPYDPVALDCLGSPRYRTPAQVSVPNATLLWELAANEYVQLEQRHGAVTDRTPGRDYLDQLLASLRASDLGLGGGLRVIQGGPADPLDR